MNGALRADLQVIADIVPERASLLDVGCGDGHLLHWLRLNKHVAGRGIEIEQERVQQAIAQGVSVIHGDVNQDLGYYPDQSFDYVVLSQTLQAMKDPKHVLAELLRIGAHAIVSVPNFGYWKNRLYLALLGRMPVTKTLSYEWYDTPNIHFCTITDFVELCDEMGIEIRSRVVVNHRGVRKSFQGKGFIANLFGQQGVFLLARR